MLSLNKIVFAGLATMLGITVVKYMAVESDLTQALDNNKQIKASVQSYKNHAEHLTNSLADADKRNKQLLKERDLLAKLRADHQQQLTSIKTKLQSSTAQLDALRLSTNETTKTWANDCVPSTVISMFKYARVGACSKDNSTN
ncbi:MULTISPECIES: hypothetical protein [unclassified Pseudoalteromonas]|uniref:hypothetical protein n=1 Tax=unclassified Pseudoalteromonas TaxID=194690 RepID=UPI000732271D|nr:MULTISPECIES: hypothetical protein [unclassified Pseudoalteromonas]KTF10379.1 hypothetical protein ATS74_10525 [Pseudoalteromonas sp. H103]MBG9991587.1 hypothetical protein [Pseudoalteromonas sp. NZS37]